MVLGEIDFSIEPPSDDAIEKYQVATELARELGDVAQDNNIQLRRTSEALAQLQQPGTRFADLDLVRPRIHQPSTTIRWRFWEALVVE